MRKLTEKGDEEINREVDLKKLVKKTQKAREEFFLYH
jgi:hypothetical protein